MQDFPHADRQRCVLGFETVSFATKLRSSAAVHGHFKICRPFKIITSRRWVRRTVSRRTVVLHPLRHVTRHDEGVPAASHSDGTELTTLGLVKRARNPADDRSVLISLTAAGRKQANSAKAVKNQIACATQFTPAEIQTLMRSLKKLRAALTGSAATFSLPVVRPITRKK